ncbi:hypothetical protein [Kitasatospora sp. NPDC059817]|uniref:hypothetical protein n=1 Tax=Kitasatospora sp. NPDC059817 TaxID=3346961 RepID=UPI003667C33F
MLDIWRAGVRVDGAWAIDAWWAVWIAKSVGITAYMVIDLDGNPNAPLVVLVDVVAALLAILLVGRISAIQSTKIQAGRETLADSMRRTTHG